MTKRNYVEHGVIPVRHWGRLKPRHIGIPNYRDVRIAFGGTATSTPTEAEVITGTQTITLTLTAGWKWVSSGAVFNAVRQDIIDGLDSNGSEATGWNTVLRDAMAVTTVARTSDTLVTITLPASPTYKIAASETVRFTLPLHAVEGGVGNPEAALEFTIVAADAAVTAALTGTFLTTPTEGEVITGTQTIIITLTGGTWIAAGAAAFDTVRQAIIDGLTSDGVEETGWNTLVRDEMAVTTVARTSDTAVTVTLPATASYSIEAEEVVTVTVPAVAVNARDTAIVATPTITIAPD